MTRIEEIEARKAEIRELMNTEGADLNLDELTEEVRALNAEIETIRATAAKADELRNLVAHGEGSVVESTTIIEERKEDTPMEIRNSKEYIDAFANYIRTGRDDECRKLLTVNANPDNGDAVVPVPEIVEGFIRTAWENDEIVSRARKSYIKGNVKVGFERMSTGASAHEEGAEANNEERIQLGIVELVPETLKKWITISDEALDIGMGNSDEFLRYIYDEMTHHIAKRLADDIVANIWGTDDLGSATAVPVPELVAATPTLGTVAQALALLSDRATDPVIIMNRQTYAAMKALQYSASYPVDPFEGLPVLFNSTMADIGTPAESGMGAPYMIIGDLANGYLCNFPSGEDIKIKYDDLSLAELDLVKIVGRMYVGHAPIAPNAFVRVVSAT